MDNVCTNFTKFNDDDRLYVYSDKKPERTVIFYKLRILKTLILIDFLENLGNKIVVLLG